MQTGERWGGSAHPSDLTGARQRKLLAEKAEREKRAEIRAQAAAVDVAAIRQESYLAGFEAGFTAGWDALATQLTEAGIDVAAVLDLDDDEDA